MSRPMTEDEMRPVITGPKATHKRASGKARERALGELYQAMTELAGVVEDSAKFRSTLEAAKSAKKEDLVERFSAFKGVSR